MLSSPPDISRSCIYYSIILVYDQSFTLRLSQDKARQGRTVSYSGCTVDAIGFDAIRFNPILYGGIQARPRPSSQLMSRVASRRCRFLPPRLRCSCLAQYRGVPRSFAGVLLASYGVDLGPRAFGAVDGSRCVCFAVSWRAGEIAALVLVSVLRVWVWDQSWWLSSLCRACDCREWARAEKDCRIQKKRRSCTMDGLDGRV